MRSALGLVLFPFLMGFDAPDARQALEAAFHNLYGPDTMAAIELETHDDADQATWTSFAYGRKRVDGETKTLVYRSVGRQKSGALLFQRPGRRDRIFVTDGRHGQVRAMAGGDYDWPFFGSEYSYDDFRTHTAEEYGIEVLGPDSFRGEPCHVLRLRPREGPYTAMLVWLSTQRPVIVRTDYFDDEGLWKQRFVRTDQIQRNFEWWVPMEEEMTDLRTGRRTIRRIRNLLVDVEVPDEIFSVTVLTRGRFPTF